MKNLWLIAAGVALAAALQFGYRVSEMTTHPLSPITNDGFRLIQIASAEGTDRFELNNGEARLLPYGIYKVTIPELELNFHLFKNNRGSAILRSIDGKLIVETNTNASVITKNL